jgi:UDP-N-acetylmuramyl tripeptide synthase
LSVRIDGVALSLPHWGRCNTYNAIAAWAALCSLGLDRTRIAPALSSVGGVSGRNERIPVGAGSLTIQLVKNPASFNEFAEHLKAQAAKPPMLIVAVNNAAADGRDTSWIWDADFEGLAEVPMVIASGARAAIVANRLKYAGLRCQGAPMPAAASLAFALEQASRGANVVYLCTYSAMLNVRADLKKRRIIDG